MFFSLLVANLKMMVRNRQALFWALVFPLIFVVVFGLFRMDGISRTKVALVDKSQDVVSQALAKNLGTINMLELDQTMTEDEAKQALKDGKVGVVLIIPERLGTKIRQGSESPVPLTLLYDQSRFTVNQAIIGIIQQFVDQTNMSLANARPAIEIQSAGIQARTARYFDFLLPGFVGMGVMTYAIIGLGSVVALYRQQKIFKRLQTTPLRVRTFFAAQIASYLLLSLVQAAIILAAGVFLFNGHVYGNILWFFILVVFANIIFLNLGFIVGAIARSVEAANGLGNAISMPMMFFSGVFFPTDSLPNVLAHAVKYLPLTPLLTALRGIAIEARPLWDYPWEIGILAIWIVVTSVIALRVFKFNL